MIELVDEGYLENAKSKDPRIGKRNKDTKPAGFFKTFDPNSPKSFVYSGKHCLSSKMKQHRVSKKDPLPEDS